MTLILFIFCCPSVLAQNNSDKHPIAGLSTEEQLCYYDSLCTTLLESDPEKSIEYGKMSLALAIELDKIPTQIESYRRIAYAHYLHSHYSKSISYYDSSIIIARNSERYFDIAISLNLMGDALTRMGNYQRAMRSFMEAGEIVDTLWKDTKHSPKLTRFHAILCTNTGNLHHSMDSLDKAYSCYEKSLHYAQEIFDTSLIAGSLSNMGMILRKKEEYSLALDNYYRSLVLLRAVENLRFQAATLNNIALIFENTGQKDSVILYYKMANDISAKLGDKYGQSLTTCNMGNVLLGEGQCAKAMDQFRISLAFAQEAKSRERIYKAYNGLADTYAQLGDFEKALNYHKLYTKLKDSVKGEETRSRVAELEIQYQTAKTEKENLALKKDKEISELNMVRLDWAILSLFGLLIFLVILFLLYRVRYKAFRNLVRKNIEIIKVEDELESTKRLLKEFCPESNKNMEHQDVQSQMRELAQRFDEFMKTEKPHFDSTISLNEISSKLSTNRTYLANAIKEEFGLTFSSYINQNRVKEAMRLLLSPDYKNYSLEGIGQLVGFNNRISFINNFKKMTGVTPSIFRNKNIEGTV